MLAVKGRNRRQIRRGQSCLQYSYYSESRWHTCKAPLFAGRAQSIPRCRDPALDRHRRRTALPLIKVSYNGDSEGVGGPDCEVYALDAIERTQVRTHFLINMVMLAWPNR